MSTKHAGESYLVMYAPTDFDDEEVLTPDDVSDVTVTIYDSAWALVLPEQAMSWNEDKERWEYQWDTATVVEGQYRARCRVVGPGTANTWEDKTIRLRQDPAAVAES